MTRMSRFLFLLFFTTVIFTACSEKEELIPETPPLPELPPQEASLRIQKVNKFLKEAMEEYYLWCDQIPEVEYLYEKDPKEYFKKLKVEDDRWSYVTDDAEALENSFKGIEKGYGWSLTFAKMTTGNVFAIVEFVYPDTPASEAKIKRGDLITKIDNREITLDNYRRLLNDEELIITVGEYTTEGIYMGTGSISIRARELKLNPVVKTRIIERDEHKIGYLHYARYLHSFNAQLDTALQNMIDNKITDLVIDLRYNSGGSLAAAIHLCSSLAPPDVVNNERTLVTFNYNDKYQQYFTNEQMTNRLEIVFDKEVPVKMGLNSIYFLTGRGTASASELTITGLKPYMPSITTVGGTTSGKYTGSWTIKPEDMYETESNYFRDFDNWAIQPIVFRYANSLGLTDFKDGFAPDIAIVDDIYGSIPLGMAQEPLLKAAIASITGTETIAMKSNGSSIPYTIIDRGASRFEKNLSEINISNTDF